MLKLERQLTFAIEEVKEFVEDTNAGELLRFKGLTQIFQHKITDMEKLENSFIREGI